MRASGGRELAGSDAVGVQHPLVVRASTQQQHDEGDPLPVQAEAAPAPKSIPLIASKAIADNLNSCVRARMAFPKCR
jgi:hypothetical protein